MCVFQSAAVSSSVLGCMWSSSSEDNLLILDTAQIPHRTRPQPSTSEQLSQDFSGLHMVAYFDRRLLCTKEQCKKALYQELKLTDVNSGFQPRLSSSLAETGS